MEHQTDRKFHDLMKMSRLELTDPAFEEVVMLAIESEELKVSARRDIACSWVFFGAGTLFGIIISTLLPQLQVSGSWIDPNTLTIGFQMLFTLFVLFHLETLLRMTKELRRAPDV